MNPTQAYLAELIGTFLLIVLGDGVVGNVLLNRTKGHGAGWIVITFGWGMAVFVGVFCSSKYSGAHLNPAVTIAVAASHRGGFTWGLVPGYLAAQMIGAFLGAVVVYLFYADHFRVTDDADAKLGVFCTGPAIRNLGRSVFFEVVGTFVLVLPIFLMVHPAFALDLVASGKRDVTLGLGAHGPLPVGLLV